MARIRKWAQSHSVQSADDILTWGMSGQVDEALRILKLCKMWEEEREALLEGERDESPDGVGANDSDLIFLAVTVIAAGDALDLLKTKAIERHDKEGNSLYRWWE